MKANPGIALSLLGPLFLALSVVPSRALVADDDQHYNEFLAGVRAEEPYIGFFAAEEKCISQRTPAYLAARRTFFLNVRACQEGPEPFIESFVEFCRENELLAEKYEETWERVLTILSYELYANVPIFDFSATKIHEHRGLLFAEYPNKKLRLDLFLPHEPAVEPIPCVVCIHGGAWRVNRRVWFEPFAQYLATHGLAAVTIDYRKLPAVRVLDCVHDAKAAVRWVRANASDYGLDPERIGALGASAGAHLVALLASTGDLPALEGDGGHAGHSSAIQAAVGIATPALQKHSVRMAQFGITADEFSLISPYQHISANSAPLLLVHGTADRVVKPGDSQVIHDKYQRVGATAQLIWIEGKGHGFYEGSDVGIAIATPFLLKQLTGL